MSLVDQVKNVLSKPEFEHVRRDAAPMQELYREMERQGYTAKQGYTIAPLDGLATQPPAKTFSSYYAKR
ncbi:hypothetical protein SAMN05428959_10829 [Duganella sp. CF517]|uniref:hypothetical protein n=1 Tax=Duganella sp. CF517 TaxID=1881038 RepID=UPI0008CECB0B|nr:hypothetical protein [Duganella sp. CF517]SEO44048.1 hypothetical protein SAMN05428959_10829 [Duganella sp. CF517]